MSGGPVFPHLSEMAVALSPPGDAQSWGVSAELTDRAGGSGRPSSSGAGVSSPTATDRPLRVLVTIPVRNEVDRLETTIEALASAFGSTPLDYRLSIAEDGSTDGTKEVLRRLPSRWPNLLIQEENDSLGRGRALRQLWSHTSADIYCFTDADLAAGPGPLVKAVLRVAAGESIVVGSRYAPGASTCRPPVRSIVSRGYNWLLRFSFGDHIRDHQCGLKAFSSSAVRELLPHTTEDSWFWDSEILILGLARGYRVAEIPVTWVERKVTRTHYQRLLSDFLLHGTGVIRLKSRVPTIRTNLALNRGAAVVGSRKASPQQFH
jgi:glycosyltransferase involved in cell wall biosynthesis